MRYARSRSLGDSQVFYSTTCGVSTGDIPVLVTTTGGSENAASSIGSRTTVAMSGTSGLFGGITSTTSSITDTTTSESGAIIQTTSGSNTDNVTSGIGLGIKYIIAIVICGIVALGTAVVMLYFCWTCHQKRKRDFTHPQIRENIPYLPGQSHAPGSVRDVPAFRTEQWAAGVPWNANPNEPPRAPTSVANFGGR